MAFTQLLRRANVVNNLPTAKNATSSKYKMCEYVEWAGIGSRILGHCRCFRFEPQSGSIARVSLPRASNRIYEFPTSGFPTRSCLRM